MSTRAIARGAVMTGGAALVIGAVLPWLTMFAGLQRYTGLIGLNGRLLLAIGIASMVAGLRPDRWSSERARITMLVTACLTTAFCAWLIVGLVEMVHRRTMAMLVPGFGPGLFIAQAGALLCAAGTFLLLNEPRTASGVASPT